MKKAGTASSGTTHVPLPLIDVDTIGAIVDEAFETSDKYIGEVIEPADDELMMRMMATRFADTWDAT